MGVFEKLFNNKEDREVSSHDVRIALRSVEHDRKKKQMEVRRLAQKRSEVLTKLKQARKDSNNEEVDFLFDDLQQLKTDQALSRRENKVLNLEAIGLKRYAHGLERLEKTGNSGRAREVIKKIQTSKLDEKLTGAAIDEEAYIDALNATLEDLNMEIEDVDVVEGEDPKKDSLLAELDEIIAAEEGGDTAVAAERESILLEKLDREVTEGS